MDRVQFHRTNTVWIIYRGYINMIHINLSDFVGRGLHRECYVHPENKDLCIKVIVAGDSSESQREQKYYSHLQKRNITWELLPKFYGLVETNLGPGAVFDLIRNHDGSISKTLAHYLASSEKSEAHYPGLSQAMSLLKNNLYQQRILTMTLKPKNILYKKTSPEEGRPIIVDNIGNSDFIPICNYSAILARNKISRKWQRFVRSVLNTYPHNAVSTKLSSGRHAM